MGRDDVNGSADGAVAPVRGEDDDRSDARLKRSVKVGEALQWLKTLYKTLSTAPSAPRVSTNR